MLVLPSSTRSFAEKEAGGKGFSLYIASSLGFKVPTWVVIGRSEFLRFLEDSEIGLTLEKILRSFETGAESPEEIERSISNLFTNAIPTPRLRSLIEKAMSLTGSRVAVRSSAADEDGSLHSFAGQLSTFLNIRSIEEAINACLRCFASAFSARSLIYRREKNLSLTQIQVAVVIQEMLMPDVSGVLFTCDPVSMNGDAWLVNATFGLGEGLVSGALDSDTFWLNPHSGDVIRQEIVTKKEALRNRENGEGTESVSVDVANQSRSVLSTKQLQELHLLGSRLNECFGRPQDVEWAFVNNSLYLLQTRPVTTLPINISGFPNLWDNSNIVESYGGITLPLSFTFALSNYRVVYQQFCEVLGVPRTIVREMDWYLRNMLGSINGRVYYNLYNWYKLIALLPGMSSNSEFMETMMGVREKLSGEIADRIRPHPSWTTWKGSLRKTRAAIRFVYYHTRIQSIVDGFLDRFHMSYERFRKTDYTRMPSDAVFQQYLEMERVMIGDWKAPIINDLLCMVHFGILRKLTTKWLSATRPGIHNDLLAGEGNLESAEPTKELIRLAGEAAKNPSLKQLLEDTPAYLLHETLRQSEHSDFCRRIEQYIDRFGHRCMNEMKLEEIDLLTEPSYLFVCLKNYLRSSTTDLSQYEQREKTLRQDAETVVDSHLNGLRRIVYRWSLRNARRAVRNRENTRFARTRAYGVARSMFQAMGRDLAGLGVLENPRDIFYLTIEEVYGIYQGTLPATNLYSVVSLRKEEYERFKNEEPDSRFLTRGAVYWQNRFAIPLESGQAIQGADLQGLPCCPGIIEGVVRVITSPSEDLTLNGEILVAQRTDPGWVPLYPSISGLLVERGSLLSHSAIVAREMGIPTIVGIPGLLASLNSGMRVRMDGERGTIEILKTV